MAKLPDLYRKPEPVPETTVANMPMGKPGWISKDRVALSQELDVSVDPAARVRSSQKTTDDIQVIRKPDGYHLQLIGSNFGQCAQPEKDPPSDFLEIVGFEG